MRFWGLLTFLLLSFARAESVPEIDRIDILGVTVFSSQMIEGVLEVSPGSPLERVKVIQTEENLQSLYLRHGYENVRIKSRLVRKSNEKKQPEMALEFEVLEGSPVRVVGIEVRLKGSRMTMSPDAMEELIEKIRTDLNLASGDVFDQEKINNGKRTIQETLASDEYVGAKVESVFASEAKGPEELIKKFKNTARWVNVKITVDLGDKVVFGYRGNTIFTKGYLDSLVDEQRLLGLGKDYIGTVRTRLMDEYHSVGFSRVKIQTMTVEAKQIGGSRRVTFLIQEGPKVNIDAVDFDGNFVFSKKELRTVFFSKGSTWIQRNVYVEKDVQKAAELLIEWMKEKGYLSARLITISSFTEKTGEKISIYIHEGNQTIVSKFEVKGAKALSPDELQAVLSVNAGLPLNLFSFSEGIEKVKQTFRDLGYLDFQILNDEETPLIKYSDENRRADISLSVEEGPQFRVSRVDIDGLNYTKDFVLRRELTFQIGEILGESQIVQSERKLRRLGIFATVTIRVIDDPEKNGYKIVKISLTEADRGVLAWGPGLRNDLGVRLFGQLAYTNLWGLNHTVSTTANINRRIFYNYHFTEGQIQFSYNWPWFLLREMTFRPIFSVGRTQYINFSADTLTLSTQWDKPLLTKPNLGISLTYTLERILQFRAVDPSNDGQLLIGTVTPKLSLDLRDNSVDPSQGVYTSAWFDYSLGSQTTAFQLDADHFRAQFRADGYIPFGASVVWSASFRSGYEHSLSATSSIPLIKQFALGGISSLRGFQEQELNVQKLYSKIDVIQNLTYVNYRTQLDLPFAGALRFAFFGDAANLLLNRYSLTEGLYFTAGFGFHYKTPVGPVNLDVGFKLNKPQFQSDMSVIHFSVGII